MDKVDPKREVPSYRARRGVLELVDVPELRYLAIDGAGDPDTVVFAHAVESLYPVAYAPKFLAKGRGRDHVVPPLEGLWWAEDDAVFTTARDKSAWRWTLLDLVPHGLSADDVAAAVERVRSRRGTPAPPRLDDVRLETLAEGRCVQTLHVGSFNDEAGVLARLHDEFVPAHGLRLTGRHHENYLTDPRRTAPERRRTILRQPVTDA